MKWYRIIFTLIASAVLILVFLPSAGIRRIKTTQKVVALTFDDGPDPLYTGKLLQTLKEKDVPATFFLMGKQVEAHPITVSQIMNAGHEVGGHSYDWERLALRRRETVCSKLDQMDIAFENAGMSNISLFRAPYGFVSRNHESILTERGLVHVGADVVVGDWDPIPAETIRDRVLKKVRPGSIIVLHDGGKNQSETIRAVPMIIDALQIRGYSFRTVGNLITQPE